MEDSKRKKLIKKVATVFVVVLLLLTFFSNTIMNYSLPEVATEPVTMGTVSNKVRGQGTVETNTDIEVTVSGKRVVKEVKVESGDEVKKGQVLFTFEDGENSELDEAEKDLESKELAYAKSLLKMAPDYTEDNIGIKDAKADLKKAIEEQEQASKNDKALKQAKKELDKTTKEIDTLQARIDDLQAKADAYKEMGEYDAMQTQLAEDEKAMKRLKEDLAIAQDAGESTLEITRSIEDKQAEIDKEKKLLEALKSSKQIKTDLATATASMDTLTKAKETQTAKVAELSEKSTLAAAKDAVKEKRKTLESLVRALDKRKEEDSLNAKSEAMDNEQSLKEIDEQKDKIKELKSKDDIKEVKAEEDGVISEISVKPGDEIAADTPIAKLQLADSGYVVKVSVTKAQSKLIRVGDEATVENVWDDSLSATVKSIRVDTENPNQKMIVTFEVKGDVNIGETLALSVGEKKNRYDAVVPNNAIKEDSKGKFVLVLKVKGTPLGNRYTVKRADVEVQASDDTSSGVTGGVYEYDNVITNSSKRLENGMQVRLVE
ncbi:MAG: HlyD family efflux transporter periplasmic adaptor subunit [Lachnospiraceae bacterium]|jgi:multidrug efflux pump subunit AcrA (membrane-fusion protein)|nr:HlyD family efflux transporter periplasmic adaptor subunit [Lachnospiraceae bacterium]